MIRSIRSDGLLRSLRIPAIGAPMFIVSSKELVAEQCKAGIVGTLPLLNARPSSVLDEWLGYIETQILEWNASDPPWPAAPYAVNLIAHATNTRFTQDLETTVAHRVPIVVTSLNSPHAVVEAIHGYGGLVLHDVSTMRHVRKAIDAGVDGLVLVCAGAGGHTGSLNPFAFVNEVRESFDGLVAVSGAISHGRQVLAAEAMGADLAYIGTRFIATPEAAADPMYKQMVLDAAAADTICSNAVSGLPAIYLRASFARIGVDPDALPPKTSASYQFGQREHKAWRDIWSAGQGVGGVGDLMRTRELVDRLATEYRAALAAMTTRRARTSSQLGNQR